MENSTISLNQVQLNGTPESLDLKVVYLYLKNDISHIVDLKENRHSIITNHFKF